MIKQFYRLGTSEEVAQRRAAAKIQGSGKSNAPSYGKLDEGFPVDKCIEYEGDVYVPLELLLEQIDLPFESMFTDTFLEIWNEIKKQTGVFPIQTINTNNHDKIS